MGDMGGNANPFAATVARTTATTTTMAVTTNAAPTIAALVVGAAAIPPSCAANPPISVTAFAVHDTRDGVQLYR